MAVGGSLGAVASALKNGILLWLAGFRDALCLHRCVVYFVHDPRILVSAVVAAAVTVSSGGNVLLLEYGLKPLVHLLLTAVVGGASAGAISSALVGLYHLLWLAPAYLVSLLVNCIWYSEIAELVVVAGQRRALQQRAQRQGVMLVAAQQGGAVLKVHRPDAVAFISQEVYRAALLAVFFAQVTLAGALPKIGPLLNFLLLSCLYALYCFDYKWSLHSVPLQQRIAYFERHWAFFLGFGCATVLPMAVASFYVGAALIGLLFPLDIMMAADSNPKLVYQQVLGEGNVHGSLPPLPMFRPACWATNQLLGNLALAPRLVRLLGIKRSPQPAAPSLSDSSLASLASTDAR
ncbi:hypothetical protein CHLNCDRAFT_137174 [Chlorella variabilis]|uniref:Uncharacterized protein n=1 Tax=Chlorella variabilis TaxID=554065 RepID=E1ZLE7_CHLVA|nr:hypothetical protein CHLNCDRAFT_137174 [Chlorella variabilis]EFN53255.1 hypothetical protein CHLNCDRAFT_137174 [Chlorella variabilis]|eukprot:XP_005845357.1 hypothetical protein CHLNCDRAFT_137174 [Chlorella variabilis]